MLFVRCHCGECHSVECPGTPWMQFSLKNAVFWSNSLPCQQTSLCFSAKTWRFDCFDNKICFCVPSFDSPCLDVIVESVTWLSVVAPQGCNSVSKMPFFGPTPSLVNKQACVFQRKHGDSIVLTIKFASAFPPSTHPAWMSLWRVSLG